MIKQFKSLFIVAAATILPLNAAYAGSSSGTMLVSGTVLNNCTVTATPLNFGLSITTVAGTVTTSSIALVCTPNASYDVALDNGANATGSARFMKGTLTSTTVPYDIFRDSAHTQHWGSTTGTGGNVVSGSAGLGLVTLTAYGMIPASATGVPADAYTDSVTVTVSY